MLNALPLLCSIQLASIHTSSAFHLTFTVRQMHHRASWVRVLAWRLEQQRIEPPTSWSVDEQLYLLSYSPPKLKPVVKSVTWRHSEEVSPIVAMVLEAGDELIEKILKHQISAKQLTTPKHLYFQQLKDREDGESSTCLLAVYDVQTGMDRVSL